MNYRRDPRHPVGGAGDEGAEPPGPGDGEVGGEDGRDGGDGETLGDGRRDGAGVGESDGLAVGFGEGDGAVGAADGTSVGVAGCGAVTKEISTSRDSGRPSAVCAPGPTVTS